MSLPTTAFPPPPTTRATPCKILYPSIRPLYRAQSLFNNVLHKMDDYIYTAYILADTHTYAHIRRERKTPLQFYKTIKGWRRSAPLSYTYIYISRKRAVAATANSLDLFIYFTFFPYTPPTFCSQVHCCSYTCIRI